MAVEERRRHELFRTAERVFGAENATTLMEPLPPVGWTDVATKADLHVLRHEMNAGFRLIDERFGLVDERFRSVDERFRSVDARFDAVDQRFDDMEAHLLAAIRAEGVASSRTLIFAMLGALATNAGLVLAALRLAP